MKYKMDGFSLKLIAIFTMLIDHIGAVFFPQVVWIRCIGRIAFPIFCFLLVEGYYHTSNLPKYMMRLGMFALLSEVPFDLLFYGKENMWYAQNIFFTLFIGLSCIYFMDKCHEKWSGNLNVCTIMDVAIALLGCLAAAMLRTDYSIVGVFYIIIFYLYRGRYGTIAICMTLITVASYGLVTQLFAVAAIPFIACYNGEKGRSMKYFFYCFYPGHLILLLLIYYAMNGVMPN